jgi:hemerythrin-like metal-binding protein
MTVIRWDPTFVPDADEIERQHHELLAIVADLSEALHDGRDRESVSWALAALSAYSGYHFGFEEQLLSAHGYPGGHERTLRQRVFARSLNEFRLAYSTGTQDLTPPFIARLSAWLDQHMAGAEHSDVARLIERIVA